MSEEWGIIDADGAFWNAADARLEQRLGTDLLRPDLCDYAVRNLGYIGVQQSGPMPRIKLRPAIVEPGALIELFYWLADRRTPCAAISWLDKTWTDEIVRSAHLRQRLGALCDRSRPVAFRRLLSRPLPLSALQAGSALRRVHDAWSVCKEITDVEAAARRFDRLFGGRFTITAPTSDAGRLIILRIGSGYKSYAAPYLRHAVGTLLEDSPDVHYGQWVGEAHRNVHFAAAPLCGEVDAIIDRAREGAHRVRYRRLILPFASAGGDRLLVTVSSLAQNVDLRVEGG